MISSRHKNHFAWFSWRVLFLLIIKKTFYGFPDFSLVSRLIPRREVISFTGETSLNDLVTEAAEFSMTKKTREKLGLLVTSFLVYSGLITELCFIEFG